MDASLTRSIPAEPHSIEELGLNLDFLADLALKTMYARGLLRGHEIAEALRLPFANVVDKVLEYLRREHLTEVRGSSGFGESSFQYVISEEGRARARELLEQNQYIGPVPVRLSEYVQMVQAQSLAGQTITQDALHKTLSALVLSPNVINKLGPAINSGKSIFLFGNAGNGKTTIAEAIGALLPGAMWIPFAVSVDGHIIKVFDALHHRIIAEPANAGTPATGLRKGERYDKRWVLIHRPLITVGGELRLENLDLIFDSTTKYYEAPYQMKANGGMFLVDDFGRQQVSPRELLNRWIVPLEKRVDYLTLATGHKIDVPFDTLVVFATNLNPRQLVDEAFLRRIRYKIHITDPTWEEYRQIFMRQAHKCNVPYSDNALKYIITEYYIKPKRQPRAVHPRDILDELVDIARFRGEPPTLAQNLIDLACQSYFMDE